MKLLMSTVVTVLAKDSRNANGNTYYSLTVLQNTQAGSINCKEDVYKLVDETKTYELMGCYNDQYKSFSVERIIRCLSDSKAENEAVAVNKSADKSNKNPV